MTVSKRLIEWLEDRTHMSEEEARDWVLRARVVPLADCKTVAVDLSKKPHVIAAVDGRQYVDRGYEVYWGNLLDGGERD